MHGPENLTPVPFGRWLEQLFGFYNALKKKKRQFEKAEEKELTHTKEYLVIFNAFG